MSLHMRIKGMKFQKAKKLEWLESGMNSYQMQAFNYIN
jgi:hypothetical protein